VLASRNASQPSTSPAAAEGPEEIESNDYIKTVNADPWPFKWTKSADDILAAIKRFCLATLKTADKQVKIARTSESGH
jgi:hypothetical protein